MLISQLAKAEENNTRKEEDVSIEQEIECPCCHDVMTLCSEFDRLGYFCEECSFSLHCRIWVIESMYEKMNTY